MELTIRPWTEDDEPALSAAIVASLGELNPWVPFAAREPISRAERLQTIRQFAREREIGGDLVYGIFDGARAVGGCGLHRRVGPGALEVGYWVATAHTGRGIATEAVGRLIEVAFATPSIRRLEIHHDEDNPASGRVADKAGFTPAGARRDDGRRMLVWTLTRP